MEPAAAEPKWRRRAEDRPDEVLDAALKMFARKGFASTKVEDIAREAGLSKGAIYRYFSSKEDIFESLVKPCDSADCRPHAGAGGNVA